MDDHGKAGLPTEKRVRELREKAEEFKRSGDYEGFSVFYRDELFPVIIESFCDKARKVLGDRRYSKLILTAGKTQEPLILSISALAPKEVHFLVTDESEGVAKEVAKRCRLQPQKVYYHKVYLDDARDVYERVKEVCEAGTKQNIAVDITGGTKAMVGGCAAAAAFLHLDQFYVKSNFNWFAGKSEPFSEELVRLKNPYEVFGDVEAGIAGELFNRHLYGLAREIYERLANTTVREWEYRNCALLSAAYDYWDRFYYREARRLLKGLLTRLEQKLHHSDAVLIFLKNQGDLLVTLSSNDPQKSVYALFREGELAEALMLDLYANALRRKEQGRYDDGIIRLYRVLEIMSQARLAAEHGLDTGNACVTDGMTKRNFENLCKLVYDNRKEVPNKLGLMDGWLLLLAMGDQYAGVKDIEDLKEMMEVTQIRNASMIEHRTQGREEDDFDKFERFVLSKLLELFPDLEDRLEHHKFLRIEEGCRLALPVRR